MIRVVGVAEAGSFRMAANVKAAKVLDARAVEGNAMGRFALELPGSPRAAGVDFGGTSYMVCEAFADSDDKTIHSGETYAIVRRISTNDTRLGEWMTEIALRKARVFSGGIELTSITACPDQARVIKALPDLDGDETKPLYVMGIAREIIISSSKSAP
jgi:hypothetical protein